MKENTLAVKTARAKQRSHSSYHALIRKIDEVLRRLLDISLALFGILVLSPLFLLIAIGIKRSSPGPVFYWGPRAGKNGKVFRILKFRTMYEKASSYQGPKVTAENDPRITSLGKMLRQTKLNELPQLWNVLAGDMSLVGPRPEDPDIIMTWPEEVRQEILSVKPGITSPASVVYRNEEELLQSKNLMDTYLWDILPTKLRLDQLYVRNRSVLTDLDVIFWTLVALIPRLKNYAVPEHLLYWGPLARFTQRFLTWFVVDFVVAFSAVSLAGVIRRLSTPLDLGIKVAFIIALAVSLLFSIINLLFGINRIHWEKARPQDAFDLAISTGIVTSILFVANLFFPDGRSLPASMVVMTGAFAFLGFSIVRFRSRLLVSALDRWLKLRGESMTSSLGERVLIIGAGEVGRFATWLLRSESMDKAFTVVGMVDDDPRKIGSTVDGCAIIGATSSIPAMVKKHDIGLILYAIAEIDQDNQERILSLCQKTNAKLIPIPDILESLKAHFPQSDSEQENLHKKVIQNATTDRLTGAYNRNHFLQLLQAEISRSLRYSHDLALIMISIDYARPNSISKSASTEAKVLQFSARICLENIRGIDLLGRYENNVLLVMLPETAEDAANLVAERIKTALQHSQVMTDRGTVTPVVDVAVISDFKDSQIEEVDLALNRFCANLAGTQQESIFKEV